MSAEEQYREQLAQKARMTCARSANGDPDVLKELLDALALWPDQVSSRTSSLRVRPSNGKGGQIVGQLSFFN